MKYINVSMIYLFYKVFIILEIRVTLISYILSKAALKAAENNGLIALISPHSVPAGSTLAFIATHSNDIQISLVWDFSIRVENYAKPNGLIVV